MSAPITAEELQNKHLNRKERLDEDIKKLVAFSESLAYLSMPDVAMPESAEILGAVKARLSVLADFIKSKAGEL